MTKSYIFECVRTWTNIKMKNKGKTLVSKNEILAVIGLELAKSICPLNRIS